MPIQFAGSSSTGDRRRRRLAVNGDLNLDTPSLNDEGGEMESQLVASAAAAPWVPVAELRIWFYAGILGVLLAGLTFALARPIPFRPALNPFVDLLLGGESPRLVILVESLFLVLSTQLGMLIAWYRSQCKLDFSGRYRVWPWAVGLFSLVTLATSTNLHRVLGKVLGSGEIFSWRGEVVAWLLPVCLIALPITVLLDRDLRQSRSSLYTLRLSGGLWYLSAWMELFHVELSRVGHFEVVRQVLPMFAAATLFLGLWLHSRIVAYVCPDPPELTEPSAVSVLLKSALWCGRRLQFWKRRAATVELDEVDESEEEEIEKPKRRRKKVEADEVTQKRKRKTPAKRAAPKTRAKVKQPEYEESSEELEEQLEEAPYEAYEETEADPTAYEESSEGEEWSSGEAEQSEEWTEEEFEQTPVEPPAPVQSEKFVESHKSHGSKVAAPHFTQQPAPRQEEEYAESPVQESYDSYESSGDDGDDEAQQDGGLTADQMKGLSKRQKRELKKQNREKQRGRG